MNAQKAKEISTVNKNTLTDIFQSIENMAKSGYNYSAHEPKKILNADQYKKELEQLGYTVKITDNCFEINW